MEAAAYQSILTLTGGPAFAVLDGRLAFCTPEAQALGLRDGAFFAALFPETELPKAGQAAGEQNCTLAGHSWELRAAATDEAVFCFLRPEESFIPALNDQTAVHTAGAIRLVLQDLTTALNSLSDVPGATEQPFADQAAQALRSVYRLRRTASALELFSGLRAGTYPLRRSRFDLALALTELCGEMGELLQTAGIRLELQLHVRTMEVCLDRRLIASLLRELVSNAAAHAGDGKVLVELRSEERDRLRMTVRNRPAEPLPEPLFHRHAAERSEGFEGLGLGLSLVSAGAACQGGSFLISAGESGEVAAVLVLPRGSGEGQGLRFQPAVISDYDEHLTALSPVLPPELYRLEDLL